MSYIWSMKLNSPKSMATGRKLIQEYGSWSAVREASRRSDSGVFVVKPRDMERFKEVTRELKKAK